MTMCQEWHAPLLLSLSCWLGLSTLGPCDTGACQKHNCQSRPCKAPILRRGLHQACSRKVLLDRARYSACTWSPCRHDLPESMRHFPLSTHQFYSLGTFESMNGNELQDQTKCGHGRKLPSFAGSTPLVSTWQGPTSPPCPPQNDSCLGLRAPFRTNGNGKYCLMTMPRAQGSRHSLSCVGASRRWAPTGPCVTGGAAFWRANVKQAPAQAC